MAESCLNKDTYPVRRGVVAAGGRFLSAPYPAARESSGIFQDGQPAVSLCRRNRYPATDGTDSREASSCFDIHSLELVVTSSAHASFIRLA